MKHPCKGKVRYASADEAGLVLVNAKIARSLHGRLRRRELAVYYCGDCVGFHLTSKPWVTR